MFWGNFSISFKFLVKIVQIIAFAVNNWSYDPNIWPYVPNIWADTCQNNNIWHCLTKTFPKILTIFGLFAIFWQFFSRLSRYLPFTVNTYFVPRPKYLGPSSSNIQYLTSSDQNHSKDIYLNGVRLVNFLLSAWAKLCRWPPSTAKFE